MGILLFIGTLNINDTIFQRVAEKCLLLEIGVSKKVRKLVAELYKFGIVVIAVHCHFLPTIVIKAYRRGCAHSIR
jgi:hypothetical protein